MNKTRKNKRQELIQEYKKYLEVLRMIKKGELETVYKEDKKSKVK